MAAFFSNTERAPIGGLVYTSTTTTVTGGVVVAYYEGPSYSDAFSAREIESPPLTKKEQRRLWTREALLAHTVALRNYPPFVIERPRPQARFKRRTRAQSSRYRVLQ